MISSTTNSHIIYMCIFLVSCYSYSCSAKDNITTGESINDGLGYLESPGMMFQMGFFSPGDTSWRYVGIWYTMDPKTVVWVANRDNPVLDSTGVLTVAEDGNFKVRNIKDASDVYFTTDVEGAPRTALKLLDTGNAVLLNVTSGSILWQSFENPTDTFLPETERKSSSPNQVLAISIVGSALVLVLFCGISYITYKRLVKRNNNQSNRESQSRNTQTQINELLHLDHSNKEGIDVPYFELESIIDATNDFSEENRLGQGGFGPVYKGKLPGGEEIAVKRLSSLSGQGLQEFKNEVTLIAKLQHRNLVRLLGYCIKGEEKMLLYEYLPNRSLDLFIFDQTLCASLTWEMRFNIIMGIARGLNYLHHDSRLRIIHRDFKTSNILLDEDMNPKISDFGLAKIVKGKDIEDVTNRVVGTFGYMSPEYALDGVFSIKSDVFSFGVVLLEILSGNRNTGFYQAQKRISLLRHAWSLWKEERPFELLDQTLMKSCNSSEVLKCICVGLLCVQGDPDDRPTMTNVVMMLGGEMAILPNPKEPAFIPSRGYASSKPDTQTKSMLTITEVAGR